MDAFFAAVEQRDNPVLRGKPVVVGGAPQSRGVVSTCSYEARKFGIHSAMPCSQAYRLCPQAIFIKPNISKYIKVSKQIQAIFYEYTDLVEPLSIDEAYLEVTSNKKGIKYASVVAKEIREQIFKRTGLTASAGVSYNKFIAKVASDMKKPNGLTVITPDKAEYFIDTLPIGRFYGIGKVTEQKLKALGVNCGKDLRSWSKEQCKEFFGKRYDYFYKIVRGIDERKVITNWERKSFGKEHTFAQDIDDLFQVKMILQKISHEVAQLLIKKKKMGKTITLKARYDNFKRITRSKTIDKLTADEKLIGDTVCELVTKTDIGERKVRLLGVTISNLSVKQ